MLHWAGTPNSKRASAACEREKKRESAATVCSLFTLPFLVLATEASCQSASRFVIPFITSSHLTPQPVPSLSPLCHVMTQWHCICICMPLIAVIWTGRDVRLYMYCVYTYIHEHTYIYPHHIHIIELPALFLPSSPSIPVQFRASFCILLSSFWAMLFAFAALRCDRQHFWLTLRPSLCRCCFYWA